MPKLPGFAMIVSDLAASMTFYVDCLGFTLVEQQSRGRYGATA